MFEAVLAKRWLRAGANEGLMGWKARWTVAGLRKEARSDRWKPLAETWAPTIEDGLYAFNDCHALMALGYSGWGAGQQYSSPSKPL